MPGNATSTGNKTTSDSVASGFLDLMGGLKENMFLLDQKIGLLSNEDGQSFLGHVHYFAKIESFATRGESEPCGLLPASRRPVSDRILVKERTWTGRGPICFW